jgi:hypothetical protein
MALLAYKHSLICSNIEALRLLGVNGNGANISLGENRGQGPPRTPSIQAMENPLICPHVDVACICWMHEQGVNLTIRQSLVNGSPGSSTVLTTKNTPSIGGAIDVFSIRRINDNGKDNPNEGTAMHVDMVGVDRRCKGANK